MSIFLAFKSSLKRCAYLHSSLLRMFGLRSQPQNSTSIFLKNSRRKYFKNSLKSFQVLMGGMNFRESSKTNKLLSSEEWIELGEQLMIHDCFITHRLTPRVPSHLRLGNIYVRLSLELLQLA
jgi:hypothetical protein